MVPNGATKKSKVFHNAGPLFMNLWSPTTCLLHPPRSSGMQPRVQASLHSFWKEVHHVPPRNRVSEVFSFTYNHGCTAQPGETEQEALGCQTAMDILQGAMYLPQKCALRARPSPEVFSSHRPGSSLPSRMSSPPSPPQVPIAPLSSSLCLSPFLPPLSNHVTPLSF